MAHSWPMETILLSICLEHGKTIEEILRLLKEKKARKNGVRLRYLVISLFFLYSLQLNSFSTP